MVAPAIKTELVDVTADFNADCRFLFKLEHQQPSGSFKLRGMSRLIEKSIADANATGKQNLHVFTSSGGNAGIAAAYASKFYGVPCTVVLPQTVKQTTLDQLSDLGASIMIFGEHWGAADEHLRNVVMPKTAKDEAQLYCHPFDNEILWEGHGDIVDEMVYQLKDLNVDPVHVKGIVCSCGGGGLYNGLVAGCHRNPLLKDVPMLVLETFQTASFDAAIKANEIVALPKIETLVTTLGSPYVATQTLANYKSHKTSVRLMDDLEAVEGTIEYFDKYGVLVEPSCGATVATATRKKDFLQVFGSLGAEDVIIFIICGGSATSVETLENYRNLLI